MSSNENASDGINRRSVLKKTGATFVAGVGATGTASACGGDYTGNPQVVFCGCSQVCWCIDLCNTKTVTVVTRSGTLGPYTDETKCVEADGIQKVVVSDGTTRCNPNTNCAKIDCSPKGTKGGPCGKPPCRHPSNKGGNGGK